MGAGRKKSLLTITSILDTYREHGHGAGRDSLDIVAAMGQQ